MSGGDHLDVPVVVAEDELMMGVADEAMWRLVGAEAPPRRGYREEVLPHRLARAAVDEREFAFDATFGEGFEPGERRRGRGCRGPLDCRSGHAVEDVAVEASDDGRVVVAG